MTGNPLADGIGTLAEILIRIGINDGPTIAESIARSIRGDDPLGHLAQERVENVVPGLALEAAMAAERIRVAHEALVAGAK